MKKFLTFFIVASMVMALLAGAFTSIPSAKAATTYTVTFNSLGGSYTPAPIKGIAYGATITLPKAPTKAGRTFSGWRSTNWTYGAVGTPFDATTPVTTNRTVYAIYTAAGVSFGQTPNSITVEEHSSPINAPAFNFVLVGKLLSKTFSLKNSSRIFKDLAPGAYVLAMEIMPGYATNSLPADVGGEAWDPADLTPLNWCLDGTNSARTILTESFTLFSGGMVSLYFDNRILHTVTFNAQGGTPTPAPRTIAYGGTITLPKVPTKAGFTFKNWNTKPDGTGTTFTKTKPVTADITVYASYKEITHTVTFDSQGGSAVAPITGIIAGTTITLPTAPILAGATFARWATKADGTGTTFAATTPVTANITVYASYTVFVPGYWYFWNIPGFMKNTTFHFPTSILQWQNSTISFLGGAK